MPHFVDDSLTPPDGKSDNAPLAVDPDQAVTAAEWNEVMQYLEDLRDRVVTTGVQTFGGAKTFTDGVAISAGLGVVGSVSAAALTATGTGIAIGNTGALFVSSEDTTGSPGDASPTHFAGRASIAQGEVDCTLSLGPITAADICLVVPRSFDVNATKMIAVCGSSVIVVTADAATDDDWEFDWFVIRAA